MGGRQPCASADHRITAGWQAAAGCVKPFWNTQRTLPGFRPKRFPVCSRLALLNEKAAWFSASAQVVAVRRRTPGRLPLRALDCPADRYPRPRLISTCGHGEFPARTCAFPIPALAYVFRDPQRVCSRSLAALATSSLCVRGRPDPSAGAFGQLGGSRSRTRVQRHAMPPPLKKISLE